MSEGIDQDCAHKKKLNCHKYNRAGQTMDVLDIQSIHADITQDYIKFNCTVFKFKPAYTYSLSMALIVGVH